jgi:hypothetical protein
MADEVNCSLGTDDQLLERDAMAALTLAWIGPVNYDLVGESV